MHTFEEYRSKFLNMAKSAGVDETITALHNEIGNLEKHVFDGGFEKDRLELVQKLRELSRELWTMRFKNN